jgi:hypothetical protein
VEEAQRLGGGGGLIGEPSLGCGQGGEGFGDVPMAHNVGFFGKMWELVVSGEK